MLNRSQGWFLDTIISYDLWLFHMCIDAFIYSHPSDLIPSMMYLSFKVHHVWNWWLGWKCLFDVCINGWLGKTLGFLLLENISLVVLMETKIGEQWGFSGSYIVRYARVQIRTTQVVQLGYAIEQKWDIVTYCEQRGFSGSYIVRYSKSPNKNHTNLFPAEPSYARGYRVVTDFSIFIPSQVFFRTLVVPQTSFQFPISSYKNTEWQEFNGTGSLYS